MTAVHTEVEQIESYTDRMIGRTKKQKETETTIRDSEREHWAGVFTRLGDGRQNRKTPKEVRAAFRQAAAMISQNRTE